MAFTKATRIANLLFLLIVLTLLDLCLTDVISRDDHVTTSCLCVTSANAIFRRSACGSPHATVEVDQCFSYTDVSQNCALGSIQQNFFRVEFNGQEMWIDEDSVEVGLARRCSSELKIIIIGDWGEYLLNGQERVAVGMAVWAEKNQPDWILTTGDNIYPNGIFRWDDPQMDYKWRDVYSQESIKNLTWYVSIGNHDMGDGGNEWNQVELSRHEPRWVLPHLWYDFVERLADHSIHFIIVDTESLRNRINDYEVMLEWFEETLRQSTADWKLVIGHRHVFSAGYYGPVDGNNLDYLVPLMVRYNVDAYLCGHDHNLQHLFNMTDANGIQYIVSGAGGVPPSRYMPEYEELIRTEYKVGTAYFRQTFGFVTLTSGHDSLRFDFYDQDARWLYSYTRQASQRKRDRH